MLEQAGEEGLICAGDRVNSSTVAGSRSIQRSRDTVENVTTIVYSIVLVVLSLEPAMRFAPSQFYDVLILGITCIVPPISRGGHSHE